MALMLYLKVFLIRFLSRINTLVDRYFISPKPLTPAFSISIPSSLSQRPGTISLYFYTPQNYRRPAAGAGTNNHKKEYPLVFNIHGGGFTIGHPTDDARWATALLKDVDAVFVSVGYRKGPEHPQPTAVEDCVDALRWLWAHASEYGIDRSRTVLTGFSAGGNLSLATPLRHYTERKNAAQKAEEDGTVTGIVAFYPSVNQSIPRAQKAASNPVSKTKGSISPGLYAMFDAAYYGTLAPAERKTINLSPALAPRAVLEKALPARLAIYTCEYDQLLVEAEDFRKDLKALGKSVGGRMVEGKAHGFDKPVAGLDVGARDAMYKDAVEQIKTMI